MVALIVNSQSCRMLPQACPMGQAWDTLACACVPK